jgi:uncharacterized protein
VKKRDVNLQKDAKFSFKPDFVANNIADIDFEYLRKLGITTIFIDLDGTVVDRGTYEVSPSISQKLRDSGLDIKITTNRPRSRELKDLKEKLHASGVIHPRGLYGKPTKKYFKAALRDGNLKASQVVMVGDRFLQDIFGANRTGIFSLLVFKLGKSQGFGDKAISRIEKSLAMKLLGTYIDTR